MATKEEVKKLAALARVTIADEELAKFTSEFDAILAYVGQLEELELPEGLVGEKPALRNIFRDDAEAYPARTFTDKIVEQFPAKSGDALLVKQIISHE